MKKIFIISFLLLTSLLCAYANDSYEALDRADAFFKNLQSSHYQTVWSILSAKSKSNIIDDVIDSYKDQKQSPPSFSELERDFSECGIVCEKYWRSFLVIFRPEEVLNNSEWSVGLVKKNYIEIQIINYKATKPATLKMYKENDQWQLGLIESFWLRKYF